MEKLVSGKLTEENRDKGDFEKKVSQIMDQNSISVSLVREELEARKKETQVRGYSNHGYVIIYI